MNEYNKKSGIVCIVGRPSTGKSSLINQICGEKISIVTPHPQTTRHKIPGIYNDNDSQIIFMDTPGFHQFSHSLNQKLSKISLQSLQDTDLILYLVDISRIFGKEEEILVTELIKFQDKLLLVFNKTDLINKMTDSNTDKIENIENVRIIKEKLNPKHCLFISVLKNDGIPELIQTIKERLDFGPVYYPDDYYTDQPIAFRIKEIIRERIMLYTKEEIPHAIYIDIIKMEVEESFIRCNAVIFVERESQKGIVIGKSGKLIKKIGIESRSELSRIFERSVDLFLKVKVNYKWRRNEKLLKKMFDFE